MAYNYTIVGIIIFCGLSLVFNSKKLSIMLQKTYISGTQKQGLDSSRWEKPRILTLFRSIIIFFGMLLILGAYPIVFGPFN